MINFLFKSIIILTALYISFIFSQNSESITNLMLKVRENQIIFSAILILYIILLAIPYIPSAEIALCLLIVLGNESSSIIYFSTIIGLMIPFLIGRYFSERKDKKIENFFIHSKILTHIGRFNPVVTLALLINMPGNTLLGGGGGIAMTFGSGKLLSPFKYLLGVLVAALPIFVIGKATEYLANYF
ncbi:hypothetical protein [Marinomonas sp. PE14-40]|uniref:hypothetical protein n=1 Tax=Marinomonas sp. PE14-40 TaxID=3060621 RepID=UPI003F6621CA